jgi:glycosyltransferase involved in cell wall biosynthesis
VSVTAIIGPPPRSAVWRGSRLRVLQVGKFYAPQRGGMETHLEALCTGLLAHADVRVVVANVRRVTQEEEVDGVPVLRVGTLGSVAGATICPGMALAIRRSRADIVHLHHPNPTATLSYLASGHRGPLVVTYHSDIVRQRVLGALALPLVHHLLSRASAIVCTSPQYLATSATLQRHRERCHVLPFGIRSEPFQLVDVPAVQRIRRAYGPRTILGVGRLVGYKGFEYLLRAMTRVDGHLLLIGEGPLRARLEALAETLGVGARVTMLGDVADVAPYYHAAALLVLPSVSRNEAFGLVQLEAMACGTPVVNTCLTSGVPFVSRHGETGLTVPPADADALAAAINELLDDPDRRARYGRTARRLVGHEFSVEAMAAGTLGVYARTLEERADSPVWTAGVAASF